MLEGAPEQALVVGHHVRVAVAEAPQELRRPLDVGEQKCDGAAGKLRHQSAFTGSRARTSKPPPGRGPASSEPPTTETRSRIPTSPCPLPPPSPLPVPLSATTSSTSALPYRTSTSARVAWACLMVFVSPSCTS